MTNPTTRSTTIPTGIPNANTTLTPTGRSRRSTPLLRELDREWARLRRRPQALRQVRSWATDPILAPVVADLRDLTDLVDATQPGATGTGTGDEVLRRLITLAGDQELAGRIVLQRILPGLISRSRRWDGRSRGLGAYDVAVGAAWLAIRTYDVGARSRHVAPALITDSLWIGFRCGSRRMVEQEIPVPGTVLGSYPSPPRESEPITALAGTLRAARCAGVSANDLDLVRQLARSGSPSSTARNCKVTVRTIRNRRDAAVANIRSALGPDWADWSDPLTAAA